MTEALTRDALLGGKLHLWQPQKGYRAGVDPVLLAATVPAQAGDSLLDLGIDGLPATRRAFRELVEETEALGDTGRVFAAARSPSWGSSRSISSLTRRTCA